MKKTKKRLELQKKVQVKRQSNPLADRINSNHKLGFTGFENLLSAFINFRGNQPCPSDELPYQIESPLSAVINKRRPIAYQEVINPCESPLWQLVNSR